MTDTTNSTLPGSTIPTPTATTPATEAAMPPLQPEKKGLAKPLLLGTIIIVLLIIVAIAAMLVLYVIPKFNNSQGVPGISPTANASNLTPVVNNIKFNLDDTFYAYDQSKIYKINYRGEILEEIFNTNDETKQISSVQEIDGSYLGILITDYLEEKSQEKTYIRRLNLETKKIDEMYQHASYDENKDLFVIYDLVWINKDKFVFVLAFFNYSSEAEVLDGTKIYLAENGEVKQLNQTPIAEYTARGASYKDSERLLLAPDKQHILYNSTYFYSATEHPNNTFVWSLNGENNELKLGETIYPCWSDSEHVVYFAPVEKEIQYQNINDPHDLGTYLSEIDGAYALSILNNQALYWQGDTDRFGVYQLDLEMNAENQVLESATAPKWLDEKTILVTKPVKCPEGSTEEKCNNLSGFESTSINKYYIYNLEEARFIGDFTFEGMIVGHASCDAVYCVD